MRDFYRISAPVERAEFVDVDGTTDQKRAIISGYFSTETPDVDRLVIPPEAWSEDIDSFWQHPILLYNHDRDRPIGKVVALEVDIGGSRGKRGLWGKAEMDMGNPLARAEFEAMERGFPRAFSVGFRAVAAPKKRGDDIVFSRNRLIEQSLVTMPANVEAGATIAQDVDPEAIVARMAAKVEELLAPALDEKVEAAGGLMRDRLAEILERLASEAIDARVGNLRDLVARVLERRANNDTERLSESLSAISAILRDDSTTARLDNVPVIDPGTGPGGGGGDPAAPAAGGDSDGDPYTPAGDKPGAGPSGGVGKTGKRPLEGTLVPEFTSPDSKDGHRHKMRVLLEDGSGETLMSSGTWHMPHSHAVDNWVVVPTNIGGRESRHPGSLSPGMQLDADHPVVTMLRTMPAVYTSEDEWLSEIITRPLPNEHACRMMDPGKFVRFSRDNTENPNVIYGYHEDGKREIQSYRYPVKDWSVAEARGHCHLHNGESFEPAEEE